MSGSERIRRLKRWQHQHLKPFDERIEPTRALASMWVQQRDRHRRGPKLGHDFHQLPGIEQVLHIEPGDLNQPHSRHAAGDIALGVIDDHPAGYCHLMGLAIAYILPR